MKNFGILLIVAGVIWGIYAFNMETSITTEGKTIGAGLYSTYIPSQTIHNLDLASRRQNHLIGAGVLFISGIILFGFGSARVRKESVTITNPDECSFCYGPIKRGAKNCPQCGQVL